METLFSRTSILLNDEQIDKIKNTKILIFGLGGVGSYCTEALIRAGISNITIVDNDIVSISNLNRQLIALHSTIGKYKVDVVEERIKDINPNCLVKKHQIFYNGDTYDLINLNEYDYIIDCIDTISSKIYLAKYAYDFNLNLISSMGTGNRLDPTSFKVTDLFKTEQDPVAKVMRYELRKLKVKKLMVLCSNKETAQELYYKTEDRRTPGSISFVPSVAGLLISSYVINEIIKK